MEKIYGKILLLGEYAVLAGSYAFSIPHYGFSGRLEFMQKPFDQKQQRSNQTLQNFRTYLEEQSSLWEWIHFDMERFGEDLTQGLYFDSVIPVHYGLGSSGALVAAIYREYAGDHLKAASLTELKHLFAGAEAFFHGRSS